MLPFEDNLLRLYVWIGLFLSLANKQQFLYLQSNPILCFVVAELKLARAQLGHLGRRLPGLAGVFLADLSWMQDLSMADRNGGREVYSRDALSTNSYWTPCMYMEDLLLYIRAVHKWRHHLLRSKLIKIKKILMTNSSKKWYRGGGIGVKKNWENL